MEMVKNSQKRRRNKSGNRAKSREHQPKKATATRKQRFFLNFNQFCKLFIL